jgi:hypothetical protein
VRALRLREMAQPGHFDERDVEQGSIIVWR